jgi:hypothetical protein
MTLARLLCAALLLCSLPAFTQDQSSGGPIIPPYWSYRHCAVPAVPWRIFPDPAADLGHGQNFVPRFEANGHGPGYIYCPQYSGHQENAPTMFGSWYTQHAGDTFCYAIRSYVVARDSKDSDSTHPAGYSTCLPSNRYQLRSADVRVDSGDR